MCWNHIINSKNEKKRPRTTLIIYFISIIHIYEGYFYTMKILHILKNFIVSGLQRNKGIAHIHIIILYKKRMYLHDLWQPNKIIWYRLAFWCIILINILECEMNIFFSIITLFMDKHITISYINLKWPLTNGTYNVQ